MAERGLTVDHSTIARWVLRYAPVMNERIRSEMRNPNGSWRVDETYIRVAGQWTYLHRALDSAGNTRFVKKRVVASQWFRCVDGALNISAGYEANEHHRKGQIRWLPKTDVLGQKRFVECTFGIVA